MSCYISSNNERIYVALESTYGIVPAITGANRIPLLKLTAKQVPEQTSARTRRGAGRLSGCRIRSGRPRAFEVDTLMTEWTDQTAAPASRAAVSGGDGRDAGVFERRDGGDGDGIRRRFSSRRRMG